MNSTLAPDTQAIVIEEFDVRRIIAQYNGMGLNTQRFFDRDTLKLYECKKTTYRFFHPASSIGDSKFYSDLSRTRKQYYHDRWEHGIAISNIKLLDTVLEVGVGFGHFLKTLSDRGNTCVGLELNPNAVKHCQNLGLKVTNQLIEDVSITTESKYDVVCSFQVLEHIYDVNSFLKHQLKVLKKGGKLIIGVPNNNPYLFVSDKYHTLNLPPHHAGLWNKKSLIALESLFNLKLLEMKFEPFKYSYPHFMTVHIQKINNRYIRSLISKLSKVLEKQLRFLLSKFIKGRNVIAVYEKL